MHSKGNPFLRQRITLDALGEPDLMPEAMANVTYERQVADAEDYHKRVKGVAAPTSRAGRRYLATSYPESYPQWACLVAKSHQEGNEIILKRRLDGLISLRQQLHYGEQR
jgi:hypothetical protein